MSYDFIRKGQILSAVVLWRAATEWSTVQCSALCWWKVPSKTRPSVGGWYCLSRRARVVWGFRALQYSRRPDFSAMFHTGIVCVIRHSQGFDKVFWKGIGCSALLVPKSVITWFLYRRIWYQFTHFKLCKVLNVIYRDKRPDISMISAWLPFLLNWRMDLRGISELWKVN